MTEKHIFIKNFFGDNKTLEVVMTKVIQVPKLSKKIKYFVYVNGYKDGKFNRQISRRKFFKYERADKYYNKVVEEF